MQQISLQFNDYVSHNEEDFVVDSSNQDCYTYIKLWPKWQKGNFGNIFYISGPKYSGKKHLSFIWQAKSHAKILKPRNFLDQDLFLKNKHISAFIIHDLHITEKYEEPLLHLINNISEEKKYLLITSNLLPSEQKIELPDLRSRVLALPTEQIHAPTNELQQAILMKYFSDRQLKVSFEIIKYISGRIERTYKALYDIVHKLDQESISQKRKITLPFVQEVMSAN